MDFRYATTDDIPTLVKFRNKLLIDEGLEPNVNIDQDVEQYFKKRFNDSSLIQLVVEDEGEIIATGGVVIYELPPSFTNKTGKKAYIANMYTKDEYRGRGIAKTILTKLLDEVRTLGITKCFLLASDMGKPLYKKFGFKETEAYMELDL